MSKIPQEPTEDGAVVRVRFIKDMTMSPHRKGVEYTLVRQSIPVVNEPGWTEEDWPANRMPWSWDQLMKNSVTVRVVDVFSTSEVSA